MQVSNNFFTPKVFLDSEAVSHYNYTMSEMNNTKNQTEIKNAIRQKLTDRRKLEAKKLEREREYEEERRLEIEHEERGENYWA